MTHGVTHIKLGKGACAVACALVFTLLLSTATTAARAATRARQQPAPAQTAEDDLERGRRLLSAGDAKGAAAALKSAAESRKTDADAWYYYGLALSRAGKQKDARKAFEHAVASRDSARARTGLAFTQFLLGKTRDAEREVARALELDPRSAQAHYVLAAVHFRDGDLEGAEREAEETLGLDPDFAVAAQLSGEALLNIFGEASERAFERYPVQTDAGPEARASAIAKREEMVAPAKARLRAAAERLQSLADSPAAGRLKEDLSELSATLKFYGSPSREDDRPEVFRQAEVTNKAVIIAKPEPGFTDQARDNGTTGVVRLRAVLAADGRVRYIVVMKRLPDGLTEKSIEAARRIRFTPATIGGRRVSQYVILEYHFGIG
ncbi:MAG TPA: energy transducer TonB [Pyrinomonadaceae bacterium]|nr:energy transducer TonB [Pyrinomonadaceae bacterium]